MKKLFCLLLSAVMVVSFASCGKKKSVDAPVQKTIQTTENTVTSESRQEGEPSDSTAAEAATTKENTTQESETKAAVEDTSSYHVISSYSADIDQDGADETIEVIRKQSEREGDSGYTDKLRIVESKDPTVIPIRTGAGETAGFVSTMSCEDLDGDGNRDVLLVFSDIGSSFVMNSFFVYNHKTGKHLYFPMEAGAINLQEVAEGFTFQYAGNGKLKISNSRLGFTGTLKLDQNGNSANSEETNKQYDKAWVDPVITEISGEDKLKLVKVQYGSFEIVAPMPVFGISTVDLIGAVNLRITMDHDFNPVLKGVQVVGYNGSNREIVGEAVMK